MITEVKYFHPKRKTMPNGCHFQRGGFLNECRINKDSFVLDESVHGGQIGFRKNRGGFIVFSTDFNAEQMNKIRPLVISFNNKLTRTNNVINRLKMGFDREKEEISAYCVGNFFKGQYVGENGEMYNEESLSVEIVGVSRRNILKFAELLAQEYRQETVLVKDLNTNRIYTSDSIPMSSDTKSMN